MDEKEIEFEKVKKNIIDYILFLKKYKYILLISIITGGLVAFFIVKTSKSKYNAKITFLINDNKTNLINPLAALASQFGGGNTGVNISDDRIIFLITTKRILGQSLLTNLNGENVTVADKLIDIFELRNWIEKDTTLNNFIKFKNLKLENLNYKENKIIDLLIRTILKSNDLQFESVKKKSTSLVSQSSSGIIVVSFKSSNEKLAKIFIESIYENLNSFYTKTITKNLKSNLDLVTQRLDSTKRLMLLKELETADELDITSNVIKYKAKVNVGRMKKDAEILNLFYSELLKNKEIAKFNYDQEQPVFEIIDNPSIPLEEIRKSLLIYVIGSVFLCSFLTLMVISIAYIKSSKIL